MLDMETYSIRTDREKRSRKKEITIVSKRTAVGIHVPHARKTHSDGFTYICNSCFGPVVLMPGDDIACPACQSRIIRKPRTQRARLIQAL